MFASGTEPATVQDVQFLGKLFTADPLTFTMRCHSR